MKAPLYTVGQLAAALDVTSQQVSQWKAAGMPFSKAGKITMAAAVRWLRERAARDRGRVDANKVGERTREIEMELAELKLARELGTVVPAGEVQAAAEEEAVRVRGLLTQMASQHAPMVATECACDIRTASRVLRRLADAVSAQLASDEPEEEAA
jgi:phage terminase Nu1 subunit (DNA packaging protein)